VITVDYLGGKALSAATGACCFLCGLIEKLFKHHTNGLSHYVLSDIYINAAFFGDIGKGGMRIEDK
jgi:hypothetical protein